MTHDSPGLDQPGWPELLTVRVEVLEPAIRVLRLSGDLNMVSAPDLEQILDGQLAIRPRALIIELSGLDFLGPDGVFVLVCAAYRAGLERIGFCLAGASRAAADALSTADMIDTLDVHDTLEDALVTYG
jgi:anti-sigma B factor antagonist